MTAEALPLLRPSAISGLVRLRARLSEAPELSVHEVCKLLAATYDGAGLDLHHARILHGLIAQEVTERQLLYQHAIRLVITKTAPGWSALLRSGREALRSVDADVLTCFQRAGAFDPAPTPAIIQWWDELAALAYANSDASRVATGRQAERLSLEYERARLAGHDDAPALIWKALDTNAAGYDIQSWRAASGGDWSPRYIEVKGSQRSPLTVFLTRHEWNTAIRLAGAYAFQVWDLPSGRMVELSVEQMRAHVPGDNGQGVWQEVSVQLDGIDWTVAT